ncbi:hypothetical protein BDY19DRAFT_962380 [Irpex rosettiformis]|uniref:Uncharacterized protein n=1 Tax=Irpex rosettiformis TaxID=378272 RepID=A0ACB8TWG7_9APHY|nr:hypothetical protein BDY19DRAFT_962380 [Irpex rosettiformis]
MRPNQNTNQHANPPSLNSVDKISQTLLLRSDCYLPHSSASIASLAPLRPFPTTSASLHPVQVSIPTFPSETL